jgi:hypothetical protein
VNRRRAIHAFLVLVFAVTFATAKTAAHDEDEGDPSFKIAKNGQVSFNTDVRFGDVVVKKGKYIVQHRIDGADHVFDFIELKGEQKTVIRSKGVFSGEKYSASVIHAKEEKDRSVRVTAIEMAGENMDHTF